MVGDEECDDGNGGNGDGCDTDCQIETGYGCTGVPSTCSPNCGDGLTVGGEACDDATDNGTYGFCNATCTGMGQYCGDGIQNGPESCDDATANGTYGFCKADCTGLGLPLRRRHKGYARGLRRGRPQRHLRPLRRRLLRPGPALRRRFHHQR